MTHYKDTIFALSTIEGRSGVAMIRISGKDAEAIFPHFNLGDIPKPRFAKYARLCHPVTKDVIDRCLVIWFPAPYSFTGEDVVELHLHGSRAVIRETISLLGEIKDFRLAESGEFSRRAFDNQKMDLTELEGLADLIDAETRIQQRQAMRQMSGELERLYENWRMEILSLLANVEAYIDFPDEDLPPDLSKKFNGQVKSLLAGLSEHLEDRRGEIIREGFHAVILGAPNVGKSSLLNYLAKRDVAIVSEIAGTTRDIVEVHLDLGGYPITISDTAGLRERVGKIEKEGIKRALARAKNADLKIIMLDASAKKVDKKSLELIDENSVVVINKSDLKKSSPNLSFLRRRESLYTIPISVKSGAGLKELLKKLEKIVSEKLTPSSSPVFTRERHRHALIECSASLKKFLSSGAKGIAIELLAEELRTAANALGKITGKIDVDEVLGKIFSSFCVGK